MMLHGLTPILRLAILSWILGATIGTACADRLAGPRYTLKNDLLTADFDDQGLVRLAHRKSGLSVELAADTAALDVAGQTLFRAGHPVQSVERSRHSILYRYAAGHVILEVLYELEPDWHFLSKRFVLHLAPRYTTRIGTAEVFRADLRTPIARDHKASSASGAVFLRLGEPGATPRAGLFLALQNPFLKWTRTGQQIAMSYPVDMEWRGEYGPFFMDRVCLGLYALSGIEFPSRTLPEWKYTPDPGRAVAALPHLDRAESDALTRCVEALALFRPTRSQRVHVPWCENDYQIDVGTPEGRTEWKRILDQAAAVGCTHTLFTPANSAVAPLADNADAWGWENCLWLGLGQKIRKGEWDIAKDPIPPSIQEMLDDAKAKGVKLVAYVYPTLGWKQQAEWTAWCGGKTGGYIGVDTGVRSFQDWFVDQLIAFQKRTGIGGYAFDHWWIAYEAKDGNAPTSKYAQWHGCRRILEELRRRAPDLVIDGRQQYQWFGTWTWLGGTYPHPTTTDEQPGSFENFPDLHFSRVSGNRQRWATAYYHTEQFTPWTLVPGYMTHQTPRNDAAGTCVRDRPFHVRDWDYLGWRYSVISSIGTAPFNHVVNLLPARDETEFRHFRAADQQWLRQWMDWTDQHRATLARLRPILGPPALGRLDGTAAIDGDHGFLFLFNPNYRELTAEIPLDATLGLTRGEAFLLRELYPRANRLWGDPQAGVWPRGSTVRLPIKGPEALVLEVVPAGRIRRPTLLNAAGSARLRGGTLDLESVEGPCGASVQLTVLLPSKRPIQQVRVNGHSFIGFIQQGDRVTVPVTFAGAAFGHCPQVGTTDPHFADRVFRAELRVPARVFAQLAARRQAWPVPYTAEELLATWRGSDRLLLYIHIADPDDRGSPGLKLDGQPIEVRKAYSDVFPLGRERTFTGFYADVSFLKPDTACEVEVTLPESLEPGRFQGLFLENVEAEYTSALTSR
ncbi:MAG TPA: hypothetical protein PKM73_09415 [Verrucomicrobiota bacterium]|nr:hypothetical protein [Verrucomicrobiota bacterium]HNU52320.1 hypothetical protein [Verrucomicrobiota bacterium]